MTNVARLWVVPLAVLVPLAVGCLTLLRRRHQRIPALALQGAHWRTALDLATLGIALIGVGALWFALAGPRLAARVPASPTGSDLVLLLDASGSMAEAGTLGGSKLAIAGKAVAQFVRLRPNDRIALVAFAGKAAVLAPLTHDHAALTTLAESLSPGTLGRGTAVGDAIAVALERLRGTPPGSGAIVLVTDGLSNAGVLDPLTAAEVAARRGLSIDTVAVAGKGGEARSVNESLLRAIADRTGGRFERVEDSAHLERAFAALSRLRPVADGVERRTEWRDAASIPAGFAAVMLLAAGVLDLSCARVWG